MGDKDRKFGIIIVFILGAIAGFYLAQFLF